ncbi:MAG: cupredoxin domain-containing protein [Xanthobacteraceae bacterium]
MKLCVFQGPGWRFLPSLAVAAALALTAGTARADDAVKLSITIKDQKFDPAELHAPPGKTIHIEVKNLNPIVSEFESADLHFEKIVPSGSQASVYVRPLQPGKYNFYDDFHHATQGYLIVP